VPMTRSGRVASVDALKVILVSWVIGCHGLMGYFRIGGWPYDEVSEATVPPFVELVVSVALGPTSLFVMGTFFFLSGMFAPGEKARHGRRGFIRRRVVRLGLAWVTFLFLVWPLCMWVAYRAAGYDVQPWDTFLDRQPFLDSGPLWFVQVLLYVSIGYALWPSPGVGRRADGSTGRRVGPRTLTLAIVMIAITTFVVRLEFPARSQQVLDLHLWQWPQCVGMFALGVLVSNQGWTVQVPHDVARWCRRVTYATLAAAPIMMVAFGVDDIAGESAPFLGGFRAEAAALAAVEAVLVVTASVALLHLAQARFSSLGPVLARCARGAYAAYLLQVPVLIGLSVALRALSLPALAKALTVGVLGVVVCLGLGALLADRYRRRR
jgi:Acyltransferase family